MSIYIKVDGEKVLHVAGTVANQRMLDEGYIEYNGEIPVGTSLKYVNEIVVVDNVANTETKQVEEARGLCFCYVCGAELDANRCRTDESCPLYGISQ